VFCVSVLNYERVWRTGDAQFLQKLNGAIIRFRRRPAAFIPSLLDALAFDSVKLQKLVIKLDPVIPTHSAQAHRDVIRTILERAIWKGFCRVHVPVGVWRRGGTFEVDRHPYSQGSLGGFELAGCSWGGFFEIGG